MATVEDTPVFQRLAVARRRWFALGENAKPMFVMMPPTKTVRDFHAEPPTENERRANRRSFAKYVQVLKCLESIQQSPLPQSLTMVLNKQDILEGGPLPDEYFNEFFMLPKAMEEDEVVNQYILAAATATLENPSRYGKKSDKAVEILSMQAEMEKRQLPANFSNLVNNVVDLVCRERMSQASDPSKPKEKKSVERRLGRRSRSSSVGAEPRSISLKRQRNHFESEERVERKRRLSDAGLVKLDGTGSTDLNATETKEEPAEQDDEANLELALANSLRLDPNVMNAQVGSEVAQLEEKAPPEIGQKKRRSLEGVDKKQDEKSENKEEQTRTRSVGGDLENNLRDSISCHCIGNFVFESDFDLTKGIIVFVDRADASVTISIEDRRAGDTWNMPTPPEKSVICIPTNGNVFKNGVKSDFQYPSVGRAKRMWVISADGMGSCSIVDERSGTAHSVQHELFDSSKTGRPTMYLQTTKEASVQTSFCVMYKYDWDHLINLCWSHVQSSSANVSLRLISESFAELENDQFDPDKLSLENDLSASNVVAVVGERVAVSPQTVVTQFRIRNGGQAVVESGCLRLGSWYYLTCFNDVYRLSEIIDLTQNSRVQKAVVNDPASVSVSFDNLKMPLLMDSICGSSPVAWWGRDLKYPVEKDIDEAFLMIDTAMNNLKLLLDQVSHRVQQDVCGHADVQRVLVKACDGERTTKQRFTCVMDCFKQELFVTPGISNVVGSANARVSFAVDFWLDDIGQYHAIVFSISQGILPVSMSICKKMKSGLGDTLVTLGNVNILRRSDTNDDDTWVTSACADPKVGDVDIILQISPVIEDPSSAIMKTYNVSLWGIMKEANDQKADPTEHTVVVDIVAQREASQEVLLNFERSDMLTSKVGHVPLRETIDKHRQEFREDSKAQMPLALRATKLTSEHLMQQLQHGMEQMHMDGEGAAQRQN